MKNEIETLKYKFLQLIYYLHGKFNPFSVKKENTKFIENTSPFFAE